MRILSGVQSSGRLHIGNYYGAIRQFVQLQDEGQAYFFIANLHALTTVREPKLAEDLTRDAAMAYVSLGLDPKKAVLFRQSDVREVLPVPEQITRVPGAKPWLRGIANLRGQLLTIVDLKSFLGAGGAAADRQTRILVVASRDVPTGLVVDEVVGFRRFAASDYRDDAPPGVIRCQTSATSSRTFSRASSSANRISLGALLRTSPPTTD